MDKADKDCIVTIARMRVAERPNPNRGGLCLPLAVEIIRELSRFNVRAVLQAGSAQWKCMAIDDGVSSTHFAYMWEMSPLTQQRLLNNMLPEMHCWVGIPSTQEIVDVSTNDLVEQAKLRAGINWTAELPPDYIWAGRDSFPSDARYMVDPIATAVALRFAIRGYGFSI